MADNQDHTKQVELLYDYVDERTNESHKAGSKPSLDVNDANQLIGWGRAVEVEPEADAPADDKADTKPSAARKK